MTTVLFDTREAQVEAARVEGGSLSIPEATLEAVTGWHREDRGLCQGERCVPEPSGANWSRDGRFDLGAFAAHLGHPAAHEDDVWSFGPAPGPRLPASGEAPDFELPDFSGKLHRLSDFRGKKIVVFAWASW